MLIEGAKHNISMVAQLLVITTIVLQSAFNALN
jgi:hypothetical protein